MNKFKKIATAVVSTVMAGTMVASLAACNPSTNGPGGTTGGSTDEKIKALLEHMSASQSLVREATNAKGWETAKQYWTYLSSNKSTTVVDTYGVLNADGSLNYDTYKNRGQVTLNTAIGHNNTETATHFSKELGTAITLPDGQTYNNGDAKPAWKAMGNDLYITWNNKYAGNQTNSNLKYLIETNEGSNKLYSQTDMFTTDLSEAVKYASSGTDILNLGDYLDYMPNFKAYLENNAIVYLSLLQAGMDTTTGANKTIYVAPYFDGNDVIERYCIIRQDWADKLLNGSTDLEGTTKFSESCGKVAVEEYMQSTGKLEIESVNKAGNGVETIVKDYDKALAAAKDESKALGAAYKKIANEVYSGTSGNIVSIMNAALLKNPDATGAQLTNLYRAYIDACYCFDDGAQYFTADDRSDLFNGYNACWDVDDLVAILRCVKTSGTALVVSGNVVQGIVPRTGQNDRTPDMVRLACQLYGVRGADSRYEYTYIDHNGVLQDARNEKEFYEAFANFNKLTQEGLIATYPASDAFSYNGGSMSLKDKGEAFMMYDYSQTQTKNDFYANENVKTDKTFSPDFNFAPIVTPIAKWDVDGDGNHTDIMRFTESWRSTKTSGLALNGALKNDDKKLAAALQFVDYLYSEDGRIVSTYGPMANANGAGGFWYNTPATQDEIDAGKYFTFKGIKYSGTEYGKTVTPTVTENVYKSFLGEKVNNFSILDHEDVSGGQLSFTDYARRVVGSTLPVGVKDQSFENQLTSKLGKAGADRVAKGFELDTIKGMTVNIDQSAAGFDWWYVCVPTGVPVSATDSANILNNSNQDHLKYITGTQKTNKNFFSIFNYIILNGLNGTYTGQDESYTF